MFLNLCLESQISKSIHFQHKFKNNSHLKNKIPQKKKKKIDQTLYLSVSIPMEFKKQTQKNLFKKKTFLHFLRRGDHTVKSVWRKNWLVV